MSQITHEGSVVRVPNVPKLSWKSNTQCAFVGALASLLSGTDRPCSERELNGLTALAFRTRWLYYEGQAKWCPSCAVGECEEEVAAVERNAGWKLKLTMENGKISDERVAEILKSIDRGIPAMVYDSKWNPAVAYGYCAAGAKMIVSDYFGGDEERETVKLPPFSATVVGFTGEPDRRAATIDALQIAVANWYTDHKRNGPAEYWYGAAAFEHWISDVLHPEGEADGPLFFVNWWNMDVLVDARKQASLWLEDVAPLLGESPATGLREAASIYAEEHRMLWRAWGEENAFDGEAGKWGQAGYRRRIAEVLGDARDLELKAITAIERAVSQERGTVPESYF